MYVYVWNFHQAAQVWFGSLIFPGRGPLGCPPFYTNPHPRTHTTPMGMAPSLARSLPSSHYSIPNTVNLYLGRGAQDVLLPVSFIPLPPCRRCHVKSDLHNGIISGSQQQAHKISRRVWVGYLVYFSLEHGTGCGERVNASYTTTTSPRWTISIWRM